jgi:uncharacterized protein (TIGR00730 family)
MMSSRARGSQINKSYHTGQVPGSEVAMRRLCVFCGSKVGNRPIYTDQARALAQLLVARGLGLVFGGGNIGLMGVLADEVLRGGGEAIGVIPQALVDKELAHRGLTHLHVCDSMHQRKALMADLSDAFMALPGGYGTADELFEILTWGQLGMHAKPVGLLNSAGFFDPLLAWLDQTVAHDFMREKHRRLLLVADEPAKLLDLLRDYQPLPHSAKWITSEDR